MPTAHVIGLGRSGIAAARLLHRQGWQVEVSDTKTTPALIEQQATLTALGMKVKLGTKFDLATLHNHDLTTPDRVVVSPGVPWQLAPLEAARAQGIETMGEMELAWQSLQHLPWVGITGTNGKTTTTALVAAIFKAAGLHAPACGNIGYSACDLALQSDGLDWVIAEVSSYQIEASQTLAPTVGVWTTFSPDHLERHGTVEHYRDIKAQLLQRSQTQIFNGDDAALTSDFMARWPQASWTSVQGHQPLGATGALPEVYLKEGWVTIKGQPIVAIDTLKMLGEHNQQNLLMAVAVAHHAGIESQAIIEAVQTFPGVAHRLEYICTWNGIDFINDSKATNYEAAETGLKAVKRPAILIAGGKAKAGAADQQWLAQIQKSAIAVLLIGEAAPQFAERLNAIGYQQYEHLNTLSQAVERAAMLAPQAQASTVLLSPACASFDQYQSFEERGEHFRSLCRQLLT